MNILQQILGAQNGGAVEQLSKQFNLNSAETTSAISQLLPALSNGIKTNMARPDGLNDLLGALKNGNHQQYIDNPSALASEASISDGNSILGHLLGSKEVSREVASRASADTGLDIGVLKKMLPAVAALAMGSVSKQSSQAGLLEQGAAAMVDPGAMLGGLSKFLDSDGDGSVADDLLGIAKKFF